MTILLPNAHSKWMPDASVAWVAVPCIGLLLASVVPGTLISLARTAIFGMICLVPILLIAVVLYYALKLHRRVVTKPLQNGIWTIVLLAGTIGLISLDVPRRAAFAVSRSSFQRLVPTAKPFDPRATVGAQAGLYAVDQYAADERGGVFFRVFSGRDMIDTISYGYAFHPNAEGTPFGAAGYQLTDLGGGWFQFSASNDY